MTRFVHRREVMAGCLAGMAASVLGMPNAAFAARPKLRKPIWLTGIAALPWSMKSWRICATCAF